MSKQSSRKIDWRRISKDAIGICRIKDIEGGLEITPASSGSVLVYPGDSRIEYLDGNPGSMRNAATLACAYTDETGQEFSVIPMKRS